MILLCGMLLRTAHLKQHIESMELKLSARINEGGSNLSSGQRQLVCLARAILNSTKILVLDEATAAVDVQTDALIQTTIRREFAERTMVVIAHRINTIMGKLQLNKSFAKIIDSDRIVVLNAGRIEEFDTPAKV